MALAPEQMRTFARHLLLPEIGPEGQERLCAAHARLAPGADPGAARIALDYLARAGVAVEDGAEVGAVPCAVPDTAALQRLAGDPRLVPAAESLAGALGAVESLKLVLGVGAPGGSLHTLVLSEGAG